MSHRVAASFFKIAWLSAILTSAVDVDLAVGDVQRRKNWESFFVTRNTLRKETREVGIAFIHSSDDSIVSTLVAWQQHGTTWLLQLTTQPELEVALTTKASFWMPVVLYSGSPKVSGYQKKPNEWDRRWQMGITEKGHLLGQPVSEEMDCLH